MQLHVTDGEELGEQPGYVQTTPSTRGGASSSPGVYALDCEMCYTVEGLKLTRVSVVNMHLEPVYETLVKPSVEITDYNTRYIIEFLLHEIHSSCRAKIYTTLPEA